MALYLPLVETLARRFRGSQAEHDDLVQAGSIGLLNAIERYDPERGDEFAAYAVPTVSGEMKRHIRDRGHRPASAGPPGGRPTAAVGAEGLTRRLGRDPSDAELAAELAITQVELAGLQAHCAARAGEAEAPAPARHEPDAADERLVLAGAFETLDDQEREIVFLRFVEDLDRKEVARRLGISESQLGRRRPRASLRSELEDDGLRRAAANAESKPAATPAPPERAGRPAATAASSWMPRPLHDDLAEAAEREGMSLNRFITALTAVIDRRQDRATDGADTTGDPMLEGA